MRPVSLPPIGYGATAVRPGWSDLPGPVRAAISARLAFDLAGCAPGTGMTSFWPPEARLVVWSIACGDAPLLAANATAGDIKR
jgi:hypothetical protein